MNKPANKLEPGDLFLFHGVGMVFGTFHFRVIDWEYKEGHKAAFRAKLEEIVKSGSGDYDRLGGVGLVETFRVTKGSFGRPQFNVIEQGNCGRGYCKECAEPLEWAALALRCPQCWKVY